MAAVVANQSNSLVGTLSQPLRWLFQSRPMTLHPNQDAQRFVDSIADQIEGESVNLFEVDGDALLQPMSEDFGLLINPESDDAIMIEPRLLRPDDESEDLEDESDA